MSTETKKTDEELPPMAQNVKNYIDTRRTDSDYDMSGESLMKRCIENGISFCQSIIEGIPTVAIAPCCEKIEDAKNPLEESCTKAIQLFEDPYFSMPKFEMYQEYAACLMPIIQACFNVRDLNKMIIMPIFEKSPENRRNKYYLPFFFCEQVNELLRWNIRFSLDETPFSDEKYFNDSPIVLLSMTDDDSRIRDTKEAIESLTTGKVVLCISLGSQAYNYNWGLDVEDEL